MSNVTTLIQSAISLFGSEPKLAAAAGVSQSSINECKHKNRVGPRVALGIHNATHGAISKSDLRPDLWPREGAAP